MKKSIFFALVLPLCIAIGIAMEPISGNSHFSTLNSNFENEVSGPKISVKGKLHRGIENRPRDGKECNCKHCFGVCDLSIEVSYTWDRIIIEPSGGVAGQSKIYFLDNPAEAESAFVIDNDLSLPSGALTGTTLASVILKQGEYQYNDTIISINVDGQLVTSYGSVVVNSANTYH